MDEYKAGTTIATVDFFDEKKFFGFATSPEGNLHISGEAVASYRMGRDKKPLREGDRMQVSYFVDGKGATITEITSIEHLEPVAVEATVQSSDIRKGCCYLESADLPGKICLPFTLLNKRGIAVQKGDVLLVFCDKEQDGYVVTSFSLPEKAAKKEKEAA